MCNFNTAPCADPGTVWYLAIGSMMFPKSYELRGFCPQQSMAAELLDYKLGFFSCQGFAEAIPSPGDSLHGVMHLVTTQEMEELDKIEAGYIRRIGKARPYGKSKEGDDCNNQNNELVDVTVYCRPQGKDKPCDNWPPHERYLEILIAGAEHFQLDDNYVKFLKHHPRQPRTPPDQYQGFPVPPNPKKFEKFPPQPTNYKSDNGAKNTVLVCLNGKVIRISYPADHEHGSFMVNMVQKYGHHFEVGMSHITLDLKFGCVSHMRDCAPQLSAYFEDRHYRFMKHNNEDQYYKVLGLYNHENDEENDCDDNNGNKR